MIAYNFNQERNVVSNKKNTSGVDLYGYRVVVLDTSNENGITKPAVGDIRPFGILKPSDETTDNLIPKGRPCDIVVDGEYLVEIASDVSIGDILVVADTDGRVRALTSAELGQIGGSTASSKIGVVGIALESGTAVSGKNILIACRIKTGIVEVPVL